MGETPRRSRREKVLHGGNWVEKHEMDVIRRAIAVIGASVNTLEEAESILQAEKGALEALAGVGQSTVANETGAEVAPDEEASDSEVPF